MLELPRPTHARTISRIPLEFCQLVSCLFTMVLFVCMFLYRDIARQASELIKISKSSEVTKANALLIQSKSLPIL